ncbi:MAG: HesA/MoeB/ThiF family protein, partial [Chitinophagaceae bacterium]
MKETIDLLRYRCQIALPGFGREGQDKLAQAKILIVGMGGLGCPAAQYLVAAGIGTIGLADFDRVSVSNLHRQILYDSQDEGLLKVDVAAGKLQKQNPLVTINKHLEKVSANNVLNLVAAYDLIIDCTDNFDSRYLLNDAAVLSDKVLVYGAIYQFEGQVSVWNYLNADGSRSPNYRDLFPEIDGLQIPNCAEAGVIPTLAGIIGCMQANEAIKYITGNPEVLAGKLLLFDALTMKSRVIKTGINSQVSITAIHREDEVSLIGAEALVLENGFFLV